jgi:hypothetical protein
MSFRVGDRVRCMWLDETREGEIVAINWYSICPYRVRIKGTPDNSVGAYHEEELKPYLIKGDKIRIKAGDWKGKVCKVVQVEDFCGFNLAVDGDTDLRWYRFDEVERVPVLDAFDGRARRREFSQPFDCPKEQKEAFTEACWGLLQDIPDMAKALKGNWLQSVPEAAEHPAIGKVPGQVEFTINPEDYVDVTPRPVINPTEEEKIAYGASPVATNEETQPVLIAILEELRNAERRFPDFNSPHEGYAIILEELDEAWHEIKHGTPERAREEMIQVAAMAIRFLKDFG